MAGEVFSGSPLQMIRVHVPEKSHEKLEKALAESKPVSLRIDLKNTTPSHRILVTNDQLAKIRKAASSGRKEMSIRLSRRQVKANVKVEGGFLTGIFRTALKFLPEILGGIAALSPPKHEGDGMRLGRSGRGMSIGVDGDGLVFRPAPYEKIDGFYIRHGDRVYRGEGVIGDVVKYIPIIGPLLTGLLGL